MTLKKIKVKELIYKKLLEIKKNGENLSDVIERLLGITDKQRNIKNCFGLWQDLPTEYFEIMYSDLRKIRDEINQRFK